jgi:hypothetical protein
MGANRTQALSVTVFLAAFTCIACGMAMGGSLVLILLGVVLLGVSFAASLKAKPWEHMEE